MRAQEGAQDTEKHTIIPAHKDRARATRHGPLVLRRRRCGALCDMEASSQALSSVMLQPQPPAPSGSRLDEGVVEESSGSSTNSGDEQEGDADEEDNGADDMPMDEEFDLADCLIQSAASPSPLQPILQSGTPLCLAPLQQQQQRHMHPDGATSAWPAPERSSCSSIEPSELAVERSDPLLALIPVQPASPLQAVAAASPLPPRRSSLERLADVAMTASATMVSISQAESAAALLR